MFLFSNIGWNLRASGTFILVLFHTISLQLYLSIQRENEGEPSKTV